MPKSPTGSIEVSQFPKQRSAIGGDSFLSRYVPAWLSPQWMKAEAWRNFIQNQPLAVIARETLIANILNLDWKIVARESEQQESLKDDVKRYTKLLERTDTFYGSMDFTAHVEWIAKDLLDLPFGAASEIGRDGDSPDGEVLWIRPLDGGILAPTLNREWPVVENAPGSVAPTFFPYWGVSRTYISPRTEIRREGWGMAPPEKIYLAMELMYRGDKYYANLLLNTPEAGILDLGDMEEASAKAWINSFRDLLYGVDAFKIPVLYEHTTDTKWIPFGNLPNSIMFDTVTVRYASMIAAGYGMSISDLGFPTSGNGGETLAGTIRQERRTKRTGYATVKSKLQSYFNQILPDDLKFVWIDYDDELQVSLGRARLANAQAFQMFVDKQIFTRGELRLQSLQDGLITVVVPDDIKKAADYEEPKPAQSGTVGQLVDNTQKPSLGGQGDALAQQIVQRSEEFDAGIEEMASITRKALDFMNAPRNPDTFNIDISMPELAFPDIPPANFTFPDIKNEITVNPTPVTIENKIDVQPTPVEITNEVQPPDVNIRNEVQPTPVEITNQVDVPDVTVNNEVTTPEVNVTFKQADRVVSTVKRDAQGRIVEVDTEADDEKS